MEDNNNYTADMEDSIKDDDSDDLMAELDELHTKAKTLFEKTLSSWADVHMRGRDDIAFYNGVQVSPEMQSYATANNEPLITVNQLPNFVQQVENELQQQDMTIVYAATDSTGSDETANIYTDLERDIENKSHFKSHVLHAAGHEGAMVPGWGFLKAELVYESNDPNNLNQEVRVKAVHDPFKCICDFSFEEPDASDANYWFEWQTYPLDIFKQNWPGATPANWSTPDSDLCGLDPQEGITVCRFWWKEEEVITYFLIANYDGTPGEMVAEASIDSLVDSEEEPGRRYAVLKDGNKRIALRRREVTKTTIKWADISGCEVLDQGIWAGPDLPYTLLAGVITRVDGKKEFRGMIRFARDAQKMLTYLASSVARRVGSSTKSPYIVDMSSIAPYKKVWDKANKRNAPYLPYNAYSGDQNQRQNPPPVRADQTAQIGDLLQACQKFEDDVKRTIGIYDAGLGATPNDQSGIAIQTLAEQGRIANKHFANNTVRAIQRQGEINLGLMQRVYDTPRVVRTIGADTKSRLVKINQEFEKNGKMVTYNMTSGGYGVTVNVGPAYANAKTAAVQLLMQLVKNFPDIGPFVQDIIARNMDFEGKDELVARLTRMLAMTAPGLIDNPDEDPVPPKAQATIAQLQKMATDLTNELTATTQVVQKLTQEKQSEAWKFEHQMELQLQKTKDEMSLNERQAQFEKEQEALRAERDALDNQAKAEMAQINARLAHTEKLLEVYAGLVKHLGPGVLDNLTAQA
ncbi:MAG: portal protein [Steroidobacteraceae bacterium]